VYNGLHKWDEDFLHFILICCDMRAEAWNSGARREGHCYITAGKYSPTSSDKWDMARQRGVFCVVLAEAV
jgi:hypothetical protein